MIVFKDFTFDSAHFLPFVPDDHKCRRMHGHTYSLRVVVEGPLDPKLGWVMDFAEINKVVKPIVEALDHRVLNDIEGMENPTAEVIAKWLWDKIKPEIPLLTRVEVSETPRSGVVYEGD